MTDEWCSTTLGDLLTFEYGRALPEKSRDGVGAPVLGSNGVVGYHSAASVSGPGIVVGRKGTAGSVTWVPSEFSPIDTTYWVKLSDSRLSLEFAYLLLLSSDLPGICAQTGVPGLNRDRAYEVEVMLPPLPVQRRIVDLLAHLDNHIANLRTEQAAATQVLSRLRAEVYGSGADRIRLGDLARVDRGASWSAKQETEEGGHPVIRIANVQPEGLDLSEVRRVEGLKPRDIARSSIGEGSILVVGSNGNPDRIGNAYLSDPALEGAVLASFLIGVHTESRDEAEFIWHCLCAPEVQAAITASTAGSTGLRNLSIEWVRDLGIPQPDAERRDATLALLRAASSVVLDLRAEMARLMLIRSGLLESLLQRKADISEAYDSLLPEVA